MVDACASAMEASGHSIKMDGGRWMLTPLGVRSVRSCSAVSAGRPVFVRCTSTPLKDMTSFNLVTEMVALGWQWRQWVPQGQRRKDTEPIPSRYVVGESKLFFSGIEISRSYLLALLRAEDLSHRGFSFERFSHIPVHNMFVKSWEEGA